MKSKAMTAALLAALWLAHGSASRAVIISNITRTGSTLTPGPTLNTSPGLVEDTLAYSDRTHHYNGRTNVLSIAAIGMAGAEYVLQDNDDRASAGYNLAVTLAEPADVYLFIDDRVGDNVNTNGPTLSATIMPWVAAMGFVDTGVDLGVDENGDGVGPGASLENFASIFRLPNVPAGVINLGPQNDGGSRNMYGVAVLPPGPGPSVPPPDPAVPYSLPDYALIDLGATGGRPEVGAAGDLSEVRQIGAAANNVNATNLAPRTLVSYTNDEFTIAIDNVDENGVAVGGLDWRDRGDGYAADPPHNQPLVRLSEDFLKNNAGVLHVTLGDLPLGFYEVTGFFVDPDNAQSENISILVDQDGGGYVDTGFVGNANTLVGGVSGLSTAKALQRATTFEVFSNGIDPVQILFDGRGAVDLEVPLAGLSLEYARVPEPSSCVLAAIGLAALAMRMRRR